MAEKSKYSPKTLIIFLILLFSLALMQWGCGQIPEEGTIVYDVEFPPADSDEAQGGGSGGGSGGSTPQNIILNASKTTLNELGSDTLTISATSDATSTTNIIVNISYGGTATRGSDYTASSDNLTILAGSTTSNSITITSLDDGIYDDGETIVVDISSVSGGDSAVESGTQQKTIVFSDDELPPAVTPPVVSISASADSITEDSGGTITITVEQDVVASIATTVTLALTGTATNTTDYNLSSTTATIAAGTLQDNLTLTPTTDSITEDNETILISIASVSGGDNASEDGVQIAEVTITDDEPLRTVTLGFDTTSVNENAGSGAITITATQSGQAQADTIVNLGVSGAALASGTDYTLNSSFITIAGGTTTGTTTIDTVNDVIDEGDNETFALEISSVTGGNGASESGTQSVTAMILDNDVAGFTQVGPTDPVGEYYGTPLYLNEGDNETFTIVLNTQPQGTVYFDIGGSAANAACDGNYYTCYALADGSQILTFDETNWNIAQSVVTLAKDDNRKRSDQRKYAYINPSASSTDPYYAALSPDVRNYIFVDTDTVGVTVSKTTSTINESGAGSTDTFTVGLDTVPLYQTYLSVTSDNTSEVTVSPSSLAYHSSYPFGFTRTVTVTGVSDDIDDGDQTVNVSIAVNTGLTSDQFYDNYTTVRTVAVTISDVDTAAFTVTESGGVSSVSESGTTDTFEVALLTKPRSGNVVIDLTSADPAEVTVSPASVTFGSGNWSTAQVITLTGQPDSAADGDQTVSITASVNDPATGDTIYDGLADQSFNVTVTNIDSAFFTVAETGGSTAVSEPNTTDTFTVVLGTLPSSNVVIDVTSADVNEAMLSTNQLTFTTGDWNTPQTVTVTAADDSIQDGNQFTVITIDVNDSLTADPTYTALANQTFTVTTADDDAAGYTITESGGSTSLNESGTTDTFTVVLNTEPSGDVVFTITSENTAEATVTSSLTFTTGNWNTAQTVTVTGVDDDEDDGDTNNTITVAINTASTADSNYDVLANQTVTATVVDDDTVGFTLTQSGGSTSVSEDGTRDDISVVLNSQPNTTVRITFTSSDTSQATVSNAFYTFDASNWDTPKSFRVLAVADQIDDGDATITVTAAIDNGTTDDAKYKALAAQTVTGITVTDIDTAAYTVTESGGDSTVSEAGSTDTFEVVLNTKPTGNVVFNITEDDADNSEISLSTSSLTFDNTNWSTPQTVTITGQDDVAADGDITTTITLAINTASTLDNKFDPLGNQTVSVVTKDNDASGITITESGGGTSVAESGTTDTFAVVLNTAPSSSVVIDLSSSDTGEVTVSPASLTFTTGNWNSAKTVTLTGVNDDLDDGNQASNVLVDVNNGSTSDGNYSGLATINVGVTTTDDDTSNFTITETAGTSVAESGTTDTFTVVLNAQPTGNVVFAISSDDTGEATVTSSLTFTTGDWNTAQTVTVTGVNDSEDDGNQTPTVTVAINTGSTNDSIYDAVADQTVSVTVTDDDSAGFTVTETGGTSVSESGTSDTFTVVLDSQPNTRVRFNLTSGDTNEVLVSPAAITFDDTNWNVAQTVTVSGTTDNEDDGDQTIAVTVAVETTYTNDANFDLLGSKSVNVNVTDIDTVGFTITESAGSTTVSETGTSDTYTIVLNTLPTGDVVFNLSSADTAEMTVSPASLTFTTGNWNSEQTVTVTGQSDSSQDGDQTIAVTAAINTGATADTQYDGVSPQNVSVTITDVDTASYTITQPASSVSETGTTTTFTVVLDLLPTANVTIDLASNDTGEATVSPSSLTFTTGDYNIAQTVTITGVDDDVDDNNQNISVSVDPNNGSADSAYGALATQLAYVTVADDDDAGFSLGSTAGLSVNESGTTDTFTVVLDTEPTADVVFAITSENTAEATVSSSLTFTSANWNTPQSVTITGVDDPLDDNDQTVSITVAINTTSTLDVLYDAVASQSTNVTVVDDEVAPLVTLSASSTTVTEDSGTITLTATQTFATASDTTVTLTGTGGTASGSDYTVGTITILAGDTTGTTSFTPDRDKVDENDETATVEITSVSSAAGATEDGTQSVTITINDDDTAELKYSHIGGSTSVTEGGSTDSLTLYLGSEPTGNVVVDITYTEQSQVEVTTPSSLQLTFTPANYMNTQVITLRAIDDDFIDGNHTSTVTISVNAGLTADSNYDGLSSKNKTVSIIDDDTSGIADFTIDSIDRDYGRLALNWTAPTGIVKDGDTTSAGGSDDYYRVYWTTVAPGARTPANRDIDQTDNATRTIDADRIIFVHGGLNSATYYYYRLAVYDTSTGAWKFSTNELGASPLPVECTSTGGTSEITDNDPDLLVYYPLNNDLQDYSPQGTRTGAEGWPYHLAEGSSDSDIDFGEGCAYGNSGYMSGSGAYDGTRGNGTWGVNNNFSNADFPANDGNWTVSVWTSPDGDLEKFTSIFSTGDNNKGPELQLDVDDKYEPIGRIRLFNKMSDNLKGQRLQQSTWYHVVVVHRANDSIDLYVNNVLKATKTSWPYTSGGNLQWDKIKIGQNRYRDANYKGYIDEFKIYGRAFTASEVANLYNFTLPPAVENINVSGQGGSTLRLTWDEVDGAIDYTIFQAEKSSSGLTNVITFTNPNLDTSTDPDLSAISGITSCTSGSCSYDVTGLTNNKYYYYRIAARNGRGSGQVSPNSEVSAQCCSP